MSWLHGILEDTVRRLPDRVAVEAEDRTSTFAELDRVARRQAADLVRRGVGPGDRVALIARNRADSVALLFACSRVGACLLPVNDRLAADEIAWILGDAEPALTILEERFSGCVPDGARVILGDAPWWSDGDTPAETPRDVVLQLYTSGTSGRPKGALLTHGAWEGILGAWAPLMGIDGTSTLLQVTPFFHVGGILMILSAVSRGTTLLLHPGFDPFEALRALRERDVTHTLMVPSMIEWVLREPSVEEGGFEALRLMVYGAAPMRVPTLKRASRVFGCGFLQGYGLTESAGVLLALRPEDHRRALEADDEEALASAGTPLDCCEVRVVDGEGNDAEVGEVVARGENLFVGYHGRPAVSHARPDGEWFRTGDVGRRQGPGGAIRIVDRKKDMILVGGENVYPTEVERVLAAHDAVVDVAVVGEPHDVWGEVPVAVCVLEPEEEVSDRALIRWCRGQLAHFKCPTRVVFRDALPRNAAGKLLKHQIVANLGGARS